MNRAWNILCWNVRGINAAEKWPNIRNKIDQSNCEIFCFQETKKENFDSSFLRNFAPRNFGKFLFAPSVGAAGGSIVGWNGSLFDGTVIEIQPFAVSVCFSSRLDLNVWNLTAVYGPCTEPAHSSFVSWFRNLDIENNDNWILLGDFNFYRSLENRERAGGNFQDTQIFNDVIDHLGLVELPLLEQLDWFFTSVNWTYDFPNTMVSPLARSTSDHVPCKVSIGTKIPKSNIFRFENYWMSHRSFTSTVHNSLNKPISNTADSVSVLSAKI